MLSDNECQQILATYRALSIAPEESHSKLIAERLTAEQLELAAMRSYAYFITSLRRPELITQEVRFATAMRESSRHYLDVHDVELATKLLVATLAFHKEHKTHIYKTCMQEDFVYADPEDAKLAVQRRRRIIKENRDVQTMIVRGHDRHKNAVWVAMPRQQQGDDPEGFVDQLIYTIERCAATTEALTLGRRDKMVAVLDCRQSSSPTIKAMKLGIGALESYYPGRLKNLIVLDLNYVLQGIYNCIKPFLDPDTRSKFLIVKGKAKEDAVSMHIDNDQAQSNCLKNGKLSPKVDGEWFVKEVPFCRLYDELPPNYTAKQECAPMPPLATPPCVSKKIPTPVKSPPTFRSKAQTLAVGSMTHCLRYVSVTPVVS